MPYAYGRHGGITEGGGFGRATKRRRDWHSLVVNGEWECAQKGPFYGLFMKNRTAEVRSSRKRERPGWVRTPGGIVKKNESRWSGSENLTVICELMSGGLFRRCFKDELVPRVQNVSDLRAGTRSAARRYPRRGFKTGAKEEL